MDEIIYFGSEEENSDEFLILQKDLFISSILAGNKYRVRTYTDGRERIGLDGYNIRFFVNSVTAEAWWNRMLKDNSDRKWCYILNLV